MVDAAVGAGPPKRSRSIYDKEVQAIVWQVVVLSIVAGIGYYLYTYLTTSRFTDMGALLLISSVLIFLIGLISEQITTLMYRDTQ